MSVDITPNPIPIIASKNKLSASGEDYLSSDIGGQIGGLGGLNTQQALDILRNIPAGNDKAVQYNDAGTLGGDDNFTWNKTSHTLSFADSLSMETPAVLSGASENIFIYTGDSSDSDSGDLSLSTGDGEESTSGQIDIFTGNSVEPGDIRVYCGATYSYVLEVTVANDGFTGNANGWTLGTGWSYNSNNVIHTIGNTAALSQAISITDGDSYRVGIIVGGTAGYVKIKLGDSGSERTIFAGTVNRYHYDIIAGITTTAAIYITPSTDFDGTIDTITVDKYIYSVGAPDVIINAGDADLISTFNLATNGTFTSNANNWTLGAGWSYNSNNVIHAAGNTATIYQKTSMVDGYWYNVSINVGGTVGSIILSLGDGGDASSLTTINAGVGFSTSIPLRADVNNNANIIITPSIDFDGTIDDIIVRMSSHDTDGGNIELWGGTSMNGVGGSVGIVGGYSYGEDGGYAFIGGGDSNGGSGNGGDVIISPGGGNASGRNGMILLRHPENANLDYYINIDNLSSSNKTITLQNQSGYLPLQTPASLTNTRIPFSDANGLLTDDADLTFSTDTLSATKISTSQITDSGLTSGRITFAGTGGLLQDDADLTFLTDTLSATKLSTSQITDSGLTITRIPYASTGGLLVDSSKLTFNGTDLTVNSYLIVALQRAVTNNDEIIINNGEVVYI